MFPCSLSLSLSSDFRNFPVKLFYGLRPTQKGSHLSLFPSLVLSFSFSPLSFHHQHAKLYSPFFFKSFSATAIILEHDITMTFIVCSCRLIGSFESKRLHFWGDRATKHEHKMAAAAPYHRTSTWGVRHSESRPLEPASHEFPIPLSLSCHSTIQTLVTATGADTLVQPVTWQVKAGMYVPLWLIDGHVSSIFHRAMSAPGAHSPDRRKIWTISLYVI